MSDRLVFLPYRGETKCEWADIEIPVGATNEEIHDAATRFAGMGGPHKVMVDRGDDPRFIEFKDFISNEFSMEPGYGGWEYSVYVAGVESTEAFSQQW